MSETEFENLRTRLEDLEAKVSQLQASLDNQQPAQKTAKELPGRPYITLAVAVATVAYAVYIIWDLYKGRVNAASARWALMFWSVAPPVWFWAEYYLLFHKDALSDAEFDRLKHGQDLAKKYLGRSLGSLNSNLHQRHL